MLPGLALDSPRACPLPCGPCASPGKWSAESVQRAAPGRWNSDSWAGARLLCSTCDVLGGRAAKGDGERRSAPAFRLLP